MTRGCESVALPVLEIWPNVALVMETCGLRHRARLNALNISARNSSFLVSSMFVILAMLRSKCVRVGPRNAFRPKVPYVRCEGLFTGSNPCAGVATRAALEKAAGSKKKLAALLLLAEANDCEICGSKYLIGATWFALTRFGSPAAEGPVDVLDRAIRA